MAPKARKARKEEGAANREDRIIAGLASAVGLEEGSSRWDVLKTVAETLGLIVQDDGSTAFQDDEDEGQEPAAKRARGDGGSEEEEEEEGAEVEELSSGSMEEGEENAEALMELAPVKVEDPRTPDQVQSQEELADGGSLFQWLISPVDADSFEEEVEERQPLMVARPANRGYYGGLFSKAEIDRLLRAGRLQYQFNVDVVSYSKGGTRENFDFNGKGPPADGEPEVADAQVVWRRFEEQDCSIRVLHPQRYSDALWRLLARLEGFLQCPVGCNAYLTPAGTQGFAPHWDDVDVYILQLEGKKRWRLHNHTDPTHVLPRHPSRDFELGELGTCCFDEVLEPGDLLYLPRGTVHQGVALPDSHSLHVTVSTNQHRTWADFLGEALPQALALAAREDVLLRGGLPRELFDFMGVVHEQDAGSDDDEEEEGGAEDGDAGEGDEGREERAAVRAMRGAFRVQALRCMEAVARALPLDSTADQLAVQFLRARLPPILPAADGPGGSSKKRVELSEESIVRLVQPGVARLVVEEGEEGEAVAVVHHCLHNSRQQHAAKPGAAAAAAAAEGGSSSAVAAGGRREGKAPMPEAEEESEDEAVNSLEFPLECVGALEELITSAGGEGVQVGQLPEPEDLEVHGLTTLGVAQALQDAGLLEVLG